jgi:flagellar FliL protein
MAEEAQEVESEPKKKKPILLIIGGVVGLIVLVAGTVVGTLFASGFFNKPPVDPDQQIDAAAHGDGHGKDGKDGKGKDGKPEKVKKDSPELTRFEQTYLQLDKDFVANLTGSRKVMSVQIAISTRYDQRVIDNIKKHDLALRATILDVLRLTVDADIAKPEFRKELAAKVREAMNSQLEKYEDFGGIEEVHFTSFLVQ